MSDNVGVVYKTYDGRTYTLWWSTSGYAWKVPMEIWLKDQIFFEKHLVVKKVKSDRMMMIVRPK